MAQVWRGRTYHITSGTSANPNKKHLFIILTEPNADDELLTVSLTSTITTDKTCIFAVDEHPFVTKESYVAYRFLEISKTSFFLSQADNRDENITDDLLNRICDGLSKSDFVEEQYLNFYEKSQKMS
jgi:hypothetical protein